MGEGREESQMGVGEQVRGLGLGPNSALENSGLVMRSWRSLRKEQCVCQAHLSYFLHFIAEETKAHSPQGPGPFPKNLAPRDLPNRTQENGELQPSLMCPSRHWAAGFQGHS